MIRGLKSPLLVIGDDVRLPDLGWVQPDLRDLEVLALVPLEARVMPRLPQDQERVQCFRLLVLNNGADTSSLTGKGVMYRCG